MQSDRGGLYSNVPRHHIYGRSDCFGATSGESLTHTDPGGTKGQTEPDLQFYSLTEVSMSVTCFCHLSVHSDALIQASLFIGTGSTLLATLFTWCWSLNGRKRVCALTKRSPTSKQSDLRASPANSTGVMLADTVFVLNTSQKG